jgi:hypothetical protein
MPRHHTAPGRGENVADKQEIGQKLRSAPLRRPGFRHLTPNSAGWSPPRAFRLLHGGEPPELAHQRVIEPDPMTLTVGSIFGSRSRTRQERSCIDPSRLPSFLEGGLKAPREALASSSTALKKSRVLSGTYKKEGNPTKLLLSTPEKNASTRYESITWLEIPSAKLTTDKCRISTDFRSLWGFPPLVSMVYTDIDPGQSPSCKLKLAVWRRLISGSLRRRHGPAVLI